MPQIPNKSIPLLFLHGDDQTKVHFIEFNTIQRVLWCVQVFRGETIQPHITKFSVSTLAANRSA